MKIYEADDGKFIGRLNLVGICILFFVALIFQSDLALLLRKAKFKRIHMTRFSKSVCKR